MNSPCLFLSDYLLKLVSFSKDNVVNAKKSFALTTPQMCYYS